MVERDARLVVQPVQPQTAMALREFADLNGGSWRVWDTTPARTEGLTSDFRSGWLVFDNGRERKRLAPIPEDWHLLTPERLVLLLRVAHGPDADDRHWRVPRPEEERRTRERRETERRLGDRRAR
jgi:hypothetical protein